MLFAVDDRKYFEKDSNATLAGAQNLDELGARVDVMRYSLYVERQMVANKPGLPFADWLRARDQARTEKEIKDFFTP